MYAYSRDLRERVLGALERGERPADIARRYEVSRVWVYQVRDRFQKTGQRSSLPMGGYRRSRIAGMEEQIRAWIKVEADLTLAEMCGRLAEHGIEIKVPALWHQLDKWDLSFKKNPARQRARALGRAGGSTHMDRNPANTRHHKADIS
jgi:transposase